MYIGQKRLVVAESAGEVSLQNSLLHFSLDAQSRSRTLKNTDVRRTYHSTDRGLVELLSECRSSSTAEFGRVPCDDDANVVPGRPRRAGPPGSKCSMESRLNGCDAWMGRDAGSEVEFVFQIGPFVPLG